MCFRSPNKKMGEFYGLLLRQNYFTTGACCAIAEDEGSPPVLLILARIAATSLDTAEVALTLESVFSMSAAFD